MQDGRQMVEWMDGGLDGCMQVFFLLFVWFSDGGNILSLTIIRIYIFNYLRKFNNTECHYN